jgi:hypothetical protein
MACPRCGSENKDQVTTCVTCGAFLPTAENPPVVDQVDRTLAYKDLIGPKNQPYYLEHFQRFDRRGRALVSWNWPALFAPLHWLLYRKMWGHAVLFLVSSYAGFLMIKAMSSIFATDSRLLEISFYLAYAGAFLVLPPLYANALYHKHCKEAMFKLGIASTAHSQRVTRGGTNIIVPAVSFVLSSCFLVATVFLSAAPVYHDSESRVALRSAATFGLSATDAVSLYTKDHGASPRTLAMAGFNERLPADVSSISLDRKGMLTLTMATGELIGKTLMFVSIPHDGETRWVCFSVDIAGRLIPPECR